MGVAEKSTQRKRTQKLVKASVNRMHKRGRGTEGTRERGSVMRRECGMMHAWERDSETERDR